MRTLRTLLFLFLTCLPLRAAFEGSNTNYLIVADSPSMRGTNGLTVSFGLRGFSIGCGGFNTYYVLFQRGFASAIPWRVWIGSHSAASEFFDGFGWYYEGPARNPNYWNAAFGAPTALQDYRMEAGSIQFGNPIPLWLDDKSASGAGSWLSVGGPGTNVDVNVNERLEIGPSQSGLCGGALVMGKLLMSEVAIYNTNLNLIQCQNLSRSHVKRMPLQIQAANLICYLPMDEYADGTWISATNAFRDFSGSRNHGSPAGFVFTRIERVCSYPPNE